MRVRKTFLIAATALLTQSLGCSDKTTDEGTDDRGLSAQCDDPSGYIPFDITNHENQDRRLAVHAEIVALMTNAVDEDGSVDGAKMAEAAALYVDPVASADLQTKVQGRVDEHVEGDPNVGEELDETILAWLAFGEQAETALEAIVARQWVDKTLQEFFFLSVYHEMIDGSRSHWDEAFGYYGSKSDNDEGGLAGLSRTASNVDDANGTNLNAEVFNGLIDGACKVDTALADADEEQVDPQDVPELSEIIEDIDGNLQKVLAFSAGHEAYEMSELLEAGGTETDEIITEAVELHAFTRPLLRIMLDRGGESQARGEELETLIDAMPVDDPESLDLDDTSWIDSIDPERIIELLEAEFDIEVLG